MLASMRCNSIWERAVFICIVGSRSESWAFGHLELWTFRYHQFSQDGFTFHFNIWVNTHSLQMQSLSNATGALYARFDRHCLKVQWQDSKLWGDLEEGGLHAKIQMRNNRAGINDRPLCVHSDGGMNDRQITREPSPLQFHWKETLHCRAKLMRRK